MKRTRLFSILAVAGLLAGTRGAPPPPTHAASPAYNMIMNWFPEPEEGGFYNAQRLGFYQKAGINSSISEYSFAINITIPFVAAGKYAFGMANADEILTFRARGAKVVAILGTYQTNDQCILWHANDKTIKTLADLSNHNLYYTFGAGYEAYLVLKYHYRNFKTFSYDFTPRKFSQDPKGTNQCFITSEPYQWGEQGVKTKAALIASTGYNPYGDLIFTTEDMIAKHPDVVRAYVKASIAGWNGYLNDASQATATNAYLETAPGAKNYKLNPGELKYSYTELKQLKLVNGGDAAKHGIGIFTLARWKTLQHQMVSIGQKVGGVDVTKAFTNQFLPKM
jgi:NitT/TauT family transport system substrate-binding protein